jgi:hypothetical protein
VLPPDAVWSKTAGADVVASSAVASESEFFIFQLLRDFVDVFERLRHPMKYMSGGTGVIVVRP